MRLSVAVVAFCFSIVELCAADDVRAAIRKDTNIPAEVLVSALKQLAHERGFQLVFQSEIVGSTQTHGAVGELTSEDALKQLLKGTGLSYRYLDEKTVTIIPLSLTTSGPGEGSGQPSPAPTTSGGQSERGLWSDFIVAQAISGQPTGPGSVESQRKQTAETEVPLQVVIVTAQKRAERLQDVPISISVLGGSDLDKSTFIGVTDALNTVPGVSAFSSQLGYAGTIVTIRGVAPNGASGGGPPTSAYYVDSVPFGMIRSALVPDMGIYDLDRVEVLRGPQGTLYGANALNGVVRILTNDPDLHEFDLKTRGAVSTTEGGGGNYSGDMAVNIPVIDGKLAVRASAGDDHESGWVDGPLGTNLNHADLGNARLKVSGRVNDQLSIGLSAWHSQSEFSAPNEGYPNETMSAVHAQPEYTQFNAYGAKFDFAASGFSVSSMTSYVDYGNQNITDYAPLSDVISVFGEITSRVVAEELNLTSTLAGPWKWSLGAMYRDARDTFNESLIFYPQPVTYSLLDHFEDTSKSRAVYGELGRRFADDKWQWTLGLRYFHDDAGTQALSPVPGLNVPLNKITATSSATTPRAVLTWTPSSDLTSYVSYSQGFRSGLPQDELVTAIVPNFSPLKPDKLTNYELGIKGTLWDERLVYNAAVFYEDWKDIQQSLGAPENANVDITVLTNANSASGEGAELSVRTQPLYGWALGADFGWNNLHFNNTVYSNGAVLFPEGARPNLSPEYTGGLSAQYAAMLGSSGVKTVFLVSGNYISSLSTYWLPQPGLPAANPANSLLMVRSDLAFLFPNHWTLALFVNNATNYYGTQGPVPGLDTFDTRPRPRTYGVRFDYRFR